MSMRVRRSVGAKVRIFTACLLLVFLATTLLADSLAELAMLGLAVVVLLAAAVPILGRGDYDAGEPLSLILVVTVLGVVLKVPLMIALGPSNDRVETLVGDDMTIVIGGLIAVGLGLIAFQVGYLVPNRGLSVGGSRLVRRGALDPRRTKLAAILIFVFSAGAFSVLVALNGGPSLDDLTAKRFNDVVGGAQQRASTGEWVVYRMSTMAQLGFLLLLALRVRYPVVVRRAVVVIAAGLAVAVPFYMNNRAGIALLAADAVLLTYLFRGTLQLRRVFLAFGGVMILVMMLLAARHVNTFLTPVQLAQGNILSRDVFDVTKTAWIVGSDLPRLHGETLVGWAAAPFPSSIWPDKPMWSELGVYVNTEVYGVVGSTSGVPAGFIGELYLNAGWLGIVIGMLLLGAIARKIWLTYRPCRGNDAVTIVYAMLIVRFLVFTLNNDLGTGLIKASLDVLPMVLILSLITRRPSRIDTSPLVGARSAAPASV